MMKGDTRKRPIDLTGEEPSKRQRVHPHILAIPSHLLLDWLTLTEVYRLAGVSRAMALAKAYYLKTDVTKVAFGQTSYDVFEDPEACLMTCAEMERAVAALDPAKIAAMTLGSVAQPRVSGVFSPQTLRMTGALLDHSGQPTTIYSSWLSLARVSCFQGPCCREDIEKLKSVQRLTTETPISGFLLTKLALHCQKLEHIDADIQDYTAEHIRTLLERCPALKEIRNIRPTPALLSGLLTCDRSMSIQYYPCPLYLSEFQDELFDWEGPKDVVFKVLQ